MSSAVAGAGGDAVAGGQSSPPPGSGASGGGASGSGASGGGASGRGASGRGAVGRVAQVHAQTRRGLALAAMFAVAAVVAALAGGSWWSSLHLFVVGSLLSAVSAATQMLAVTWSSAPPAGNRVAATQRWLLAVGAVVLVVGHEVRRTPLLVAGGGAVVVAMVVLAALLLRIRSEAVTPRYGPAIEAYVVGILAGSAGMSLGIVLGAGWAAGHAVALRGAHLTLNLFGLIGVVIAGTLPFFAATQVRAKMSSHATPRRLRSAVGVLTVATLLGAAGRLVDARWVVAGGLASYAVGLVAIAVLLPVNSSDRFRWAGPRVVQLLAGLGWWIALTVALAGAAVAHGPDRHILRALVVGGFAQILVASLAYLVPVVRAGGHHRLTRNFAVTRSWPSVLLGNGAAVAAWCGWNVALAVLAAVWAVDVTARLAVVALRRWDVALQ